MRAFLIALLLLDFNVAASELPQAKIEQIGKLVGTFMSANEVPGLSIAVVVDGNGEVVATAGLWPPAPGVPVTELAIGDVGRLRTIRLAPPRTGGGYAVTDLAELAEAGRLTAAAVRPT